MNKRIRELAEESHNEFYNVHIDLELFAELIVRECCDAVNDGSKLGDWYNMRIKEHFGVK